VEGTGQHPTNRRQNPKGQDDKARSDGLNPRKPTNDQQRQDGPGSPEVAANRPRGGGGRHQGNRARARSGNPEKGTGQHPTNLARDPKGRADNARKAGPGQQAEGFTQAIPLNTLPAAPQASGSVKAARQDVANRQDLPGHPHAQERQGNEVVLKGQQAAMPDHHRRLLEGPRQSLNQQAEHAKPRASEDPQDGVAAQKAVSGLRLPEEQARTGQSWTRRRDVYANQGPDQNKNLILGGEASVHSSPQPAAALQVSGQGGRPEAVWKAPSNRPVKGGSSGNGGPRQESEQRRIPFIHRVKRSPSRGSSMSGARATSLGPSSKSLKVSGSKRGQGRARGPQQQHGNPQNYQGNNLGQATRQPGPFLGGRQHGGSGSAQQPPRQQKTNVRNPGQADRRNAYSGQQMLPQNQPPEVKSGQQARGRASAFPLSLPWPLGATANCESSV
jgi:hypothetical protein